MAVWNGATIYIPGGASEPQKGGNRGAVAAAVGAGLLYWKLHTASCKAGWYRDKLVNEKDDQTYNLTNKKNKSWKRGERGTFKHKTKDSG
jgi:hypothetical protein